LVDIRILAQSFRFDQFFTSGYQKTCGFGLFNIGEG